MNKQNIFLYTGLEFFVLHLIPKKIYHKKLVDLFLLYLLYPYNKIHLK